LFQRENPMKALIKIISFCFLLWLIGITYAQHTVGDTAILYVGEYADDSDMRQVYILDIENPTQPLRIGMVNQHGSDTGWSPDGRYVYIVNYDAYDSRVLTLFDVNRHAWLVLGGSLLDNECSLPLYWSPDGRYLAYQHVRGEQVQMSLWDSINNEGYIIENVREEPLYYDNVWSADGRYLALTDSSGTYESDTFIWDTVSRSIVTTFQTDMYYNFRWSPDARYFVYVDSSIDATITIYNLIDNTQVSVAGNELGAISPDGRYVVYFQREGSYGDATTMYLYDTQTRREILVSETASVFNTQWSPDSRSVTFKTWHEGFDQGVSLYDVTTSAANEVLPPSPLIRYAFWSATSQYIAVVYSDDGRKEEAGELAIYNRETGELQHFDYDIPNLYYAFPLYWSPLGDYLVIDTDDSGDVMLDAAQNSMVDLSNTAGTNPHIIPNWSADGQYMLFGGYDGDAWHIQLYDMVEQVAVSLAPDIDWNGFIGWRGTNHNNSLIYCGEG
jgi:Tol biopolymer transport system component